MSVTSRTLLVTSTIKTQAVVSGSVSGDTTTITRIKLTQTKGNWFDNIKKSEMPKIMIIDGVQYTWNIKSTFTDNFLDETDTFVKEAVLNIGTKLVVNKPIFRIETGEDPINSPYTVTFSFYDIGKNYIDGVSFSDGDFEIDGKTAQEIEIFNTNEDKIIGTVLTKDATYRFSWEFGTKKYQVDKKLESGKTNIKASYTPPMSWLSEFPEQTWGRFYMRIQVIFGTTVHWEYYKYNTARVPDTCVPVINSIKVADTLNRVPQDWGMFVQENSNVSIAEIDITKSYSSEIQSIKLTVGEKSYSGTPQNLPKSLTLHEYGIVDVTVKATDARGRTAEKSARITVVEYHPPTLSVDSMRCDQNGEIENEGIYFLAQTTTTYSTCNGKNTLSLYMMYKLTSETNWQHYTELETGVQTTVCGGDLDTELSYDVKYVLTDKFNTITVTDFVSTAVYAMHFLHGGRGIAFGHKATEENAADFYFDAIFRNNVTFKKANGDEVTIQQILEKIGL